MFRVSDDAVEYTTVAEEAYDEEFEKALVKVGEANIATSTKRTQTFLKSEIPVRPCTHTCPIRNRCEDYLSGRVLDNDLCKPELRQIKKWQTAFRKGELDRLKDDVGAVAGSLAVQINRLLEAVNQDGVMIELVKYSAAGDRYTEWVTHPALKEAANMLKTLGIDLNTFLMTPKSQKDDGPKVQVNVGISMADLNSRWQERFSGKAADDS